MTPASAATSGGMQVVVGTRWCVEMTAVARSCLTRFGKRSDGITFGRRTERMAAKEMTASARRQPQQQHHGRPPAFLRRIRSSSIRSDRGLSERKWFPRENEPRTTTRYVRRPIEVRYVPDGTRRPASTHQLCAALDRRQWRPRWKKHATCHADGWMDGQTIFLMN